MKKQILKIAAAALLVGGLAFNLSINSSKSNTNDVNIELIKSNTAAFGESGLGVRCKYIPEFADCGMSDFPYSYCPTWACM